MKSAFSRSILALAAILTITGASAQEKLKSYQSGTKEFWTNPPPDWFLGDETEAQKGLAPPAGPPTGASDAELADLVKKIKLPAGFKIEVYASGVLSARQMAWGDNGTLFVGSFDLGNVYAIRDEGGKRTVKTVVKGLKMPTGVAFLDGALYVGSPEMVAMKIVTTMKLLGLSRFELKYANGTMPHDKLMTSLELYGTRVAPMVRERLAD